MSEYKVQMSGEESQEIRDTLATVINFSDGLLSDEEMFENLWEITNHWRKQKERKRLRESMDNIDSEIKALFAKRRNLRKALDKLNKVG